MPTVPYRNVIWHRRPKQVQVRHRGRTTRARSWRQSWTIAASGDATPAVNSEARCAHLSSAAPVLPALRWSSRCWLRWLVTSHPPWLCEVPEGMPPLPTPFDSPLPARVPPAESTGPGPALPSEGPAPLRRSTPPGTLSPNPGRMIQVRRGGSPRSPQRVNTPLSRWTYPRPANLPRGLAGCSRESSRFPRRRRWRSIAWSERPAAVRGAAFVSAARG